jgi:hypothetical protein
LEKRKFKNEVLPMSEGGSRNLDKLGVYVFDVNFKVDVDVDVDVDVLFDGII